MAQQHGSFAVFDRFMQKNRTVTRKPKSGRRISNSNSRATTVLKAMSNSQRLEILTHLLNGEEHSVKQLEEKLKTLSQSACHSIWGGCGGPIFSRRGGTHK